MKFESKLGEGIFLKRYKRFFADLVVDGKTVTAHVPNTGSLKTCNAPDSPCRFTHTDDPNRKLKYTLQMIKTPSSWVGVNTSLPNKLVKELFESSKRNEWKKFDRLQSEVKISAESRIDIVLWNSKDHPDTETWKAGKLKSPMRLIEIKNVTLAEGSVAMFPDAVTERGQKHLHELMAYMKKGYECELVFVIQRQDCKSFSPCDDIDPEYGTLLRQAVNEGLIITPLVCSLSDDEIVLENKVLKLEM